MIFYCYILCYLIHTHCLYLRINNGILIYVISPHLIDTERTQCYMLRNTCICDNEHISPVMLVHIYYSTCIKIHVGACSLVMSIYGGIMTICTCTCMCIIIGSSEVVNMGICICNGECMHACTSMCQLMRGIYAHVYKMFINFDVTRQQVKFSPKAKYMYMHVPCSSKGQVGHICFSTMFHSLQ